MMQYGVNLSASGAWTHCPLCGQVVTKEITGSVGDETTNEIHTRDPLVAALDNHLCNECPDGWFAAHLVADMEDAITILVGKLGTIVEIRYIGSDRKPSITEITICDLEKIDKRCHGILKYTINYIEKKGNKK